MTYETIYFFTPFFLKLGGVDYLVGVVIPHCFFRVASYIVSLCNVFFEQNKKFFFFFVLTALSPKNGHFLALPPQGGVPGVDWGGIPGVSPWNRILAKKTKKIFFSKKFFFFFAAAAILGWLATREKKVQ